jgi:hypothetical protein
VERGTRSHLVAALTMLAGAVAIAVGARQPWAVRSEHAPAAQSPSNGSFGFDALLTPTGTFDDVRPLLFGGSAVLALMALLLLFTHIPRVGVLWRFAGLTALIGPAAIAMSAWEVVKEPPLVIATSESPTGMARSAVTLTAQSDSLVAFGPGPGLWLLILGCGATVLGALIPARRRRAKIPSAARRLVTSR